MEINHSNYSRPQPFGVSFSNAPASMQFITHYSPSNPCMLFPFPSPFIIITHAFCGLQPSVSFNLLHSKPLSSRRESLSTRHDINPNRTRHIILEVPQNHIVHTAHAIRNCRAALTRECRNRIVISWDDHRLSVIRRHSWCGIVRRSSVGNSREESEVKAAFLVYLFFDAAEAVHSC